MKNTIILKLSIVNLVMLLFTAILSFSSCKRNSNGPKLDISERVFKFVNVRAGDNLMDSFFISNNGNKPLVINKISGDCSCLRVKITKNIIQPGDRSKVNFSIDTENKYGREKNFILIEANTDSMLHYVKIISEISDPE